MPPDMLTHALAYAEQGWPVFPCNSKKRPMVGEGVNDATTNRSKIKEWWERWPNANIGMAAGQAGFLIIDVDPGADYDELRRRVEGLPETKLKQRTPRGGEHLFYALGQGEIVPTSKGSDKSGLCQYVDVRSDGGYVLLPPSCTEDGIYTWGYNDWPAPKAAYRTDAMVKACGEKRQKARNADVWLIEPDLPKNITDAIEYLRGEHATLACRPAIEGQGGNQTTYETAAMMRSFGLSPDKALDLLHEVYNDRCIPPWDYDDLATLVGNAYSYAISPPGNVTKGYKTALARSFFKPVSRDTKIGDTEEALSGRYRFVDYSGLMATPDPEWLIPGLIEEKSYTLLVAAPKTGKTFAALDIALSVAVGPGKGGGRMWPEVKAGSILYAISEGRSGSKARVKAWCEVHNGGKKPSEFVMADPVPLVSAGVEDWAAFVSGAKAWRDNYALVVIDTAGRAMAGMDESTAKDASQLTLLVAFLQEHLDCAVLVIHHEGHSAKGRARGSMVFEADPDTVLVMSREPKAMVAEIDAKYHRSGPEWDKPRLITFLNHGDTFVATDGGYKTPAPAVPVTQSKSSKFKPADAFYKVIDDTIEVVLSRNKLFQWSTAKLAEAVAMEPTLEGVSSEDLRKKHLVVLRERSTSKASKCYDPAIQRWRWTG